METGNPFENVERINIPALLNFISPELYNQNFIIIFVVLIIHCFMMALTLRVLRGSHSLVTLLYFVPFVWVVSITSYIVEIGFGGMLSS
jgi:archaellum biogenesis protein FlaJ (TadC family)